METHGATATLTTDGLLDLLHRRDVALAQRRSVVATALRLSETELRALIHLVHEGDMAASELAERLDLSSGGVVALVQRLAARGHVTRHADPADRRSTRLRVTPTAAGALNAADASLRAGLDALTSRLSGEEQATIAAFLTALAERFERHAAGRRGQAIPATDALERPVA